ncbi:error-prone DNA polymerase [Maricaulis sp. CAU 1757]
MTSYVELLAASNFSFLRGASHPDEMVAQATGLGLAGLGLADRNSAAGLVRGHLAAKETGLPFFPGVRLVTKCGLEIAAYPKNRTAWGRLTRTLTDANFRAEKGRCDLAIDEVVALSDDHVFILVPPAGLGLDLDADYPEAIRGTGWMAAISDLLAASKADTWLALIRHFDGRDGERLHRHAACAAQLGLDPVAAGEARYHAPGRKALADVVTCIREHVRIDEAGWHVAANAERHLKAPDEMVRLFRGYEDAVARTAEIAARLKFSLDELVYDYPDEVIGENETPMQTLRRLAREGLKTRYPDGAPERIRGAVATELDLIEGLDYASYFLTVYDIVRFARSQGILCQGRGSAANSAVCYMIGITEVDPARIDLLFERFVSAERGEPPDIDVDFEHQRREEVIQYVYEKYGRRRAAMTATVNCYRPRGAIREVGKVFGLTGDVISALSKSLWGWSSSELDKELHAKRMRDELGLDPDSPALSMTLRYARELMGFPRHLSQHPGGFVMTRARLDEMVPLHNAAMPDRTMLEWDKEDIDALGLMKVDVLGLGMLSCVARALDLLAEHYDRPMGVDDIPAEDPAVYDMICKADTIGVFQIESRAQMTMLPRLKPRNFYDLVIEVAIVRPGPIQGDMVHPYLRRRDGREAVEYPSQDLKDVLGKTLGIPLFQEQAMRIAIVAAGFSPAEADKLRRSMAAFRRSGTIYEMGQKLMSGMIANGYQPDFAERCFKQLEGFGEYGFPESHAASFALIVYVSCWLKHYYPDVFLAALLNSQPMGFYAPAQLVRDAREHDVEVVPPDINFSDWDSTLEGRGRVRLGLRQIKGMKEAAAARIVAARQAHGRFYSVSDLARRARLDRGTTDRLANADAFASLALDRRQAGWSALAEAGAPLPLFEHADDYGRESEITLPALTAGEDVARDYSTLRLSLKAHPLSFFRPELDETGHVRCADLADSRDGRWVTLAGLVLVRQRPGSASGVIFATLEDETGVANVIIWPKCFEAHRRIVMASKLMGVTGRVQKEGQVIHVVASRLTDQSWRLAALADGEEFAESLARADEIARPNADPRTVALYRRAMKGQRLDELLPKSRDFH